MEQEILHSLGRGVVTGIENTFEVKRRRCMADIGHYLFEVRLNGESQVSPADLRMRAFEEITRALTHDGWDVSQDLPAGYAKTEFFPPECMHVGGESDRVEIHFDLDTEAGRVELNIW